MLERDSIPEIKVKVLWLEVTPIAGFAHDRATNEIKLVKDL